MRREILAGVSTFFTLSYFFVVYPQILSEGGLDLGASLTAAIASLVITTLFLGFYAHFPAVLAPSLSIGAFLVYSVILPHHTSWQIALGIAFWAGLILFLLSIFKVRQKIFLHLPPSLISSSIAGIGLFLICVGLKNLDVLIPTSHGPFLIGPLATLPNAIALFGLLLLFTLYHFRIASAFLLSILTCWAIALLLGLTSWEGVATSPPSPLPSLFQLDLLGALHPHFWKIILSVILISLIDSTASLTTLARMAHAVDTQGQIKHLDRLLIPDGLGSMLSASFGTGTLSFFLESSSGIKAGGRTGITALVAALCCLSPLFFYPLIASIPIYASTPALIAIGCFMTLEVKHVPWRDWTDLVPALLTLLVIPLTFSIYQGFSFGFLSFALLKTLTGQWQKIHPVCWALALIFLLHLVF